MGAGAAPAAEVVAAVATMAARWGEVRGESGDWGSTWFHVYYLATIWPKVERCF